MSQSHDAHRHEDGDREHGHDHPHGNGEHPHEHGHAHGEHVHGHGTGPLGWLREILPFAHGHSHGEVNVDSALEGSAEGIRALKVSLVGLGVTAPSRW